MKRLALLLILWAAPAYGVVAVDSSSEAGGASGASGLSWPHTVTGANTVLACTGGVTDARTISAFTHNSLTLTQHATKSHGNHAIEMWYRIAPTTGSNTVAITFSGSANASAAGCTSFTGARQTSPLGVAQNNTNAGDLTTSPPSITVPTNGIAYDAVFFGYGDTPCETSAAGGSQTIRFEDCLDSGANASMTVAASTRATTGTMLWTNQASAFEGQIAVPISEAATGSAAKPRVITVE